MKLRLNSVKEKMAIKILADLIGFDVNKNRIKITICKQNDEIILMYELKQN